MIALLKDKGIIARNIILGSIFSNLLLIPGICCLTKIFESRDRINYLVTGKNTTMIMLLSLILLGLPMFLERDQILVNSPPTFDAVRASSCLLILSNILHIMFLLVMNRRQYSDKHIILILNLKTVALFLITMLCLVFLSVCIISMVDTVANLEDAVLRFITLILIPNIGNAVAHLHVIIAANKITMLNAIEIPLENSTHLLTWVLPLLINLEWLLGAHGMIFNFFEVSCFSHRES